MESRAKWRRLGWVSLFVCVLAGGAGVGVHFWGMRRLARGQEIRVGMQESPPWYFLGPGGQVEGPVADIVEEAARRSQLKLKWVVDPEGPRHALDENLADVWPLMGRLPDREERYPISSSWLDVGFLLVSLAPCEGGEGLVRTPRVVAHRDTEVTRQILAGSEAAGLQELKVGSHLEAMRAMCAGAADMALVAETSAAKDALRAPEECSSPRVCLSIKPAGTVEHGIGSRPDSRDANAAAVMLRRQIDDMVDDGTLAGILLQWGVPSGEIRALRAVRLARNRANLLGVISLGLLVMLMAMVIVARRLRHARAALEVEFKRRQELEERYAHARKMESLGRMAGAVAHDFNNLLTVINGFSELVLKRANGTPVGEMVREVLKAGNKASELTGQLLTFSQRRKIEMEPVDVNAVVRDSRRMLEQMAGAGIEVVCRLEAKSPIVCAGPGHVGQALMNLTTNARDAMPEGGRLTIATENVDLAKGDPRLRDELRPGAYLRLTVSDTGTGMDEATHARLFEPFFTTKTQGKGTGLGLPIVYGIVEQAQGKIEVRSSVGKGTEFEVLLPVAD